jgi:hypothetical protein
MPLPTELKIPWHVELEGKTFILTELDAERRRGKVLVTGRVDADAVVLGSEPTPLDGTKPNTGIILSTTDFTDFMKRVVDLLAFMTDVPLRFAKKIGARLVPENATDEATLQQLGTNHVLPKLATSMSTRSFLPSEITEDRFQVLAAKQHGVALYAEALLVGEPVAVFRGLWMVLESAFAEKDQKLLALLSEYEPARVLKFTKPELKALLILRGRISHAESKAGVIEYKGGRKEAERQLPRVKCLVEQVLVTKKNWGAKDLDTERLASVAAYLEPTGTIVFIQPHAKTPTIKQQEEALE